MEDGGGDDGDVLFRGFWGPMPCGLFLGHGLERSHAFFDHGGFVKCACSF